MNTDTDVPELTLWLLHTFQLLVINRAAFFEVFVGADGRTDTASLMKFITHMQKVPNKKWLQNKVDARKSWQAFKKSVLHDCSLEKRMRTSKIIRVFIYSLVLVLKRFIKAGCTW